MSLLLAIQWPLAGLTVRKAGQQGRWYHTPFCQVRNWGVLSKVLNCARLPPTHTPTPALPDSQTMATGHLSGTPWERLPCWRIRDSGNPSSLISGLGSQGSNQPVCVADWARWARDPRRTNPTCFPRGLEAGPRKGTRSTWGW